MHFIRNNYNIFFPITFVQCLHEINCLSLPLPLSLSISLSISLSLSLSLKQLHLTSFIHTPLAYTFLLCIPLTIVLHAFSSYRALRNTIHSCFGEQPNETITSTLYNNSDFTAYNNKYFNHIQQQRLHGVQQQWLQPYTTTKTSRHTTQTFIIYKYIAYNNKTFHVPHTTTNTFSQLEQSRQWIQ